MAEDVKVAGHKWKKWQVGAVVVGGAAVAYYIYKKQQSASSAASSATGIDPVTGLPYSQDNTVDPLTGMTYLTEAQQYGSVQAAESAASTGTAGYAAGGLGGSGTSVGPLPQGSLSQTLGYTSGGGYASNADWAQAVESGLTTIGYTPTDVASAMGRYLAGLPLTPDQVNIVNVAIAEYGEPPAGAPPIVAAPATGPATSGSTPPPAPSPAPAPQPAPAPAPAPAPSPMPYQAPAPAPTPAPRQGPPPAPVRIDISGTGPTSISCHWTDVAGASSYLVQVTYQSRTVKSFTAPTYSTVIGGLTPDHTYGIHVSSIGPGGTSSPAATWAKTTR